MTDLLRTGKQSRRAVDHHLCAICSCKMLQADALPGPGQSREAFQRESSLNREDTWVTPHPTGGVGEHTGDKTAILGDSGDDAVAPAEICSAGPECRGFEDAARRARENGLLTGNSARVLTLFPV